MFTVTDDDMLKNPSNKLVKLIRTKTWVRNMYKIKKSSVPHISYEREIVPKFLIANLRQMKVTSEEGT